MFDYPSMSEHAHSPTLTRAQIEFFRRLAVPEGADPRAVSPLHADDLSGLAPALVVVPTLDPVADQGRAYAERLREAGTPGRRARSSACRAWSRRPKSRGRRSPSSSVSTSRAEPATKSRSHIRARSALWLGPTTHRFLVPEWTQRVPARATGEVERPTRR